ncbi:MAG TPA: sugar phosphate isomerase/epimerase family protein [Tepidisphaeraceae bacterium]|nr:sugar phosphate isomerase/epimerase family protein [Tepidisphaeraceae bacterium]
MLFGICTPVEHSAAVRAAGWDFVEERVDQLIQGLISDDQWQGGARAAKSVMPILAANVLVPPVLKITGPEADPQRLLEYMKLVVSRSANMGIKTLVFGSGGARNVPDGFDRNHAKAQIIDFLKMTAPLIQARGITLAIEHLNHKECNIINSISEAMTYVRELNHPSIQCLADTFHFWLNSESLDSLAEALPSIVHVHVSDRDRSAPGFSRKEDYRPFFAILKSGGYYGPISVEANWPDMPQTAAGVLEYIKKQWKEA